MALSPKKWLETSAELGTGFSTLLGESEERERKPSTCPGEGRKGHLSCTSAQEASLNTSLHGLRQRQIQGFGVIRINEFITSSQYYWEFRVQRKVYARMQGTSNTCWKLLKILNWLKCSLVQGFWGGFIFGKRRWGKIFWRLHHYRSGNWCSSLEMPPF